MNNVFKYYLYFILIAFVYSNQSIAVVTKSKGDVQYKKFSESDSKILLVGSELFNDDYIKTGVDGYVKFSYLDDGTTIKIHKNSELYVAGKSENKVINKRLNIGNGLIKMDVSKQKEEEFKIVTPTSVASVKGTSFILDSNLDFGDKFYGFEGIVEIVNKESNKIIRLSRNLKVVSQPDGQIISEIMTPSDINAINEIQSSVNEDILDQNIIDDTDIDINQNQKEIKIKVVSPTGEEKEIIIKYSE
tara:strand:+ start:315 stop:1052 length:738 start_codon:yes stop_codon:yes gene_type:complete